MGFLNGLVKGISGFFGGGTPPPYQTPQNIQNFMQPITENEMQKVGLYDNIVNAKLGYDYANKNIEGWGQKLADPALTDEQRQKINQKIQAWGRERDAHAQTANQLRGTATALGVDIADYGSDKTPQQSAQALANYKNLAVQNFLNDMPTLAELEKNRYRELRSRGASPSRADSIIAEERGEMNSRLARRLGDFMTTYGTNPDGSINQDLGIAAMTRILPDPQSVAQLFASGFAMPNKVYDTNRAYAQAMDMALVNRDSALALADVNNAAAIDRAKYTTDANLLMSREGQAGQNERLRYTVENQNEQNRLQREHAEKLAFISSLAKGGTGQSKMWQEINELALVYTPKGATDEQKKEAANKAIDTWMRQHYPRAYNQPLEELRDWADVATALNMSPDEAREFMFTKAGYKPPQDSKSTEELKKAGNLFGHMFDDVQETILKGDKKSALQQLEEVRELLRSKEYRELLDKDAYTLATKQLKMYTKLANGEYESNQGKTEYIKDRYEIEYGIQPTSDEIQRIMMNEDFFGVPTRPKVKTPAWEFNVAPMPASSMYNSGAAYSNPNPGNQNPAYVPYGQAAWTPNR